MYSELSEKKFHEDSKLTKIGDHSFLSCNIQEISIPPNLEDITNLDEFELIIPDNSKFFKYLDNNKHIIIGKNDIVNSTDFDTIFKGSKEAESIFIPSTIKYISRGAFYECSNLKEVKYEKNSQLKSIGSFAFYATSNIEEITIPSSVEFIDEHCFACSSIKKIDFEPNSKLTTFEHSLFERSSIESISFPPNLKKLKYNWHKDTNIKSIIVPPENHNFVFSNESKNKILLGKTFDSDNDLFDTFELVIPSTIKIIKDAFVNTKIKRIFIPKNVVKIDGGAFNNCLYVKSIEFEEDSNLESIGYNAISLLLINQITLPRKLKSFDLNSFIGASNLQMIEFLSDEIVIKSGFDRNVVLVAFTNARKIIFNSQMIHPNKSLVIFTLPFVLDRNNSVDEYEYDFEEEEEEENKDN